MYFFFPGNYMWSQAILRLLHSGGAVGEVMRGVERLQQAAQEYDYEAWHGVWRELGDHLWRRGEGELAADHPKSGRESFLRACCYYQWAIPFMDYTDARKGECHQRSIDAFARYAALSEPAIERVEVPYEGTSFPGWFVPGAGGERQKPTVFYLPGLDSTKEQGLPFALSVAARGFNVLLVDGPGVGETVQFRGMVNRHDYEVPGRADFEYLATRSDVDPARIGVVGVSLGGYRAPRVAAFEHRLAACVAWGAIWDYGAIWDQRQSERGAVPTPHSHVLHVMGAKSLEEVREKARPWRLDGVAQAIRCPLLVMHGENDAQVPIDHARRLYDVAGSPQKELKIFTEEEGGAAHCQNDNRLLAHAYIADWLEDTLMRGKQRQGVVVPPVSIS